MVESLPPGNAAGALGPVSGPLETIDGGTDIGGCLDDNVHVEHRFGSQAGHRGAANVLDLNREATHRGPQLHRALGESMWPLRIVFREIQICRSLHDPSLTTHCPARPVSALIGAERYERNEDRTNERNGHRSRTLTTKAGDVDLASEK